VIAHDTTIGAHSFISPGAVLAGFVRTGRCAWLGLGAKVIENVTVGDGAVVAAGAVVLSDVAPFTLVAGVPATARKAIERFDVGGTP